MNETQNMNNGYMQDGQMPPVQEERYIPKQYKEGGPNPVKSILLTFLIMLAFLAIQVVVMIPFIMAGAFKTVVDAKQSGASMDESELYNAMMGSIDSIGLTIIATLVSLIVAVIWYRLAYCRGFGFKELKKTCKRIFNLRTVGGIVLSAICLFYLTNFVLIIVEMISPSTIEEYNKLISDLGIEESDWKVIILTVIMAPINEECIMRGLILMNLKKNMAPVIAILISALYFGIFHLNIVQGIYAAILGVFMAYLAYKYKSIIASMLFHAVFNGMNYVLALFPESIQNSMVLAFAVPMVTGVLRFFLEGRKKIEENA